ncbi:MAG: hydroxyacylglutathione hydrolase [bacterium]|nr:hydroxyacylglutathione hydrolase [bacterium]
MLFEQISSGGDRNFGYLVACEDTKQAAVIDPSPDPDPVYRRVRELGLTVKYIINTHTHYDHTGGNSFFKEHTDAPLVTHSSAGFGDMRVGEGDTLPLGNETLSFIHTPGHTPESMCVQAGKNLVTGDTLFVGKVGGTAGREAGTAEFESLKKLMQLDPGISVWPGHNYGVQPTSTIGNEKKTNPFILRLNNIDEFFGLKENWASYKIEHGIT